MSVQSPFDVTRARTHARTHAHPHTRTQLQSAGAASDLRRKNTIGYIEASALQATRLLRTSTRRTGRHAPAERTMRYCCRTCHSAPRASAREQTETQRRPTRTLRSAERTRSARSPAQSVEPHGCTCHVACAAVVSGSRPTAERCPASSGRCESIRAWHAQPCESSRQHASTARPSSTQSMYGVLGALSAT